MKNMSVLSLTLASALGVSACGSSGGDESPAATCEGKELKADEAHNYKFQSTLTLPPVKVASSNKDLTFDWSAATMDITHHSFDPKKAVKMVSLFAFGLPADELQKKMIHDDLAMADMLTAPLVFQARDDSTGDKDGKTSAKLLDFTLSGNPVIWEGGTGEIKSYFDASKHSPSQNTFTLMVSSSDTMGAGVLTIQSFVLDSSSDNTEVKLTKDSAQLSYKADLTKLKPAGVPANTPDLSLNWDDIQKNAMGDNFVGTNITHAMIGHYKETPKELNEKFLDIDRIALELYQLEVTDGSPLKFADLQDSEGNQFPGITEDGTWLVALQCQGTACHNPAPWYLSILQPVCKD